MDLSNNIRVIFLYITCIFFSGCGYITNGSNEEVIITRIPLPTNGEPSTRLVKVNSLEIENIYDVALTPKGHSFFIAGSKDNDYFISSYDSDSFSIIWDSKTNWVDRIAISSDGNFLATSPYFGYIDIWDAETGEVVSEYHDKDNICDVNQDITFTLNDSKLISAYSSEKIDGSYSTSFYKWDGKTGTCLGEQFKHDGWLTRLGIDPDGRFLVASLTRINEPDRNQILLWDMQNREIVCRIPGKAFYFSPRGELLIPKISENGEIEFKDLSTCKTINMIDISEYPSALTFTITGKQLFTGTESIKVWDALKWELIHEVDELPNYPNHISRLLISFDDHYLFALQKKIDSLHNDVFLQYLLSQ